MIEFIIKQNWAAKEWGVINLQLCLPLLFLPKDLMSLLNTAQLWIAKWLHYGLDALFCLLCLLLWNPANAFCICSFTNGFCPQCLIKMYFVDIVEEMMSKIHKTKHNQLGTSLSFYSDMYRSGFPICIVMVFISGM